MSPKQRVHIADSFQPRKIPPASQDVRLSKVFIEPGLVGRINLSKVATAVRLRFAAGPSPALDEGVRKRLAVLAGRRTTRDGAGGERVTLRARAGSLERPS
jgi:ribosome-associated protein